MDCRVLDFSPEIAQKRFERAAQVIEPELLLKLIAFALHLLGATRGGIAQLVGRPPDSVKSSIRTLEKEGLDALQDRRRRQSRLSPPPPATEELPWELMPQQDHLVVQCGSPERRLLIPQQNVLQKKTVLLSAVADGLLTAGDVALHLDITPTHTRNLARKLRQQDVSGLLDKRRGQQQEFRITPEVKAELIQQFVLDVVQHGKVSGRQLAEHLAGRCDLELSERTVRDHLRKLGLPQIAESLPEQLAAAKKNS